MSLELNSKGLYQSSGKGKQDCCFVLPSSTKREIRLFHIVVVQRRQTEKYHTKKRDHVQSCYFAKLNLLVYCRSPCRRRRRWCPWFIPGTYVSLCTESYLFIYLFTYLFIYLLFACIYEKKVHLIWVSMLLSTIVLFEDTIFTAPAGDGTAILRGHPSHAKV